MALQNWIVPLINVENLVSYYESICNIRKNLHEYLSLNIEIKTLNILSLMFLSNLIESMGNTAMFGYLPKLLQRFGVSPEDIGYIVGQIQAVYFVGCCFFLLLYSKVVTKFNARKSFMLMSFLEALAFLFVAFSNSVSWIFIGALIISVPVTKSALIDYIVYEISDESNQALYFTVASTASFNAGLSLGPALGGLLSFPLEQFPDKFPNVAILSDFLVVLPNLLLLLCMLVTIIQAAYAIPIELSMLRCPKISLEENYELDQVIVNQSASVTKNDLKPTTRQSLKVQQHDESQKEKEALCEVMVNRSASVTKNLEPTTKYMLKFKKQNATQSEIFCIYNETKHQKQQHQHPSYHQHKHNHNQHKDINYKHQIETENQQQEKHDRNELYSENNYSGQHTEGRDDSYTSEPQLEFLSFRRQKE